MSEEIEIENAHEEQPSKDQILGGLSSLCCRLLSEVQHGRPQQAREALKKIDVVVEWLESPEASQSLSEQWPDDETGGGTTTAAG